MVESELTYRGSKVKITGEEDNTQLMIDGEPVTVTHVRGDDQHSYWTPALAFRHFRTVEELAKALIDYKRK